MSNPHMRALLDVSTAHLSLETRHALDFEWDPKTSPMIFSSTEYGWFMWAPVEWHGNYDTVPADLREVLVYARSQGAEYVLFDADGPVHDSLTVYEEPA